MISKFLYQKDLKGKRIITGVVTSDTFSVYDTDEKIDMVLENTYQLKEGETKSNNFGKLYYVRFSDNTYLNLNDYMLKVSVEKTDRLLFATPVSLNVAMDIVSANFDEEDIKLIDSGYSLSKDIELTDIYISMFKRLKDDQYVEIVGDGKPKFITYYDNKYELTEDFNKAKKIFIKELRQTLILNDFLNPEVSKKDFKFSHFNLFRRDGFIAFLGDNSFEIKLENDKLTFNRNIEDYTGYELFEQETLALGLRNILYMVKKPKSHVEAYLLIDDGFIKKEKNEYFKVNNIKDATKMPLTEAAYIKEAYKLLNEEININIKSIRDDNPHFLYKDNIGYFVSDLELDYDTKIIDNYDLEKFNNSFKENKDNNLILLSNDKYVTYEIIDNKLKFSLLNSAFEAKLFNDDELYLIKKYIEANVSKKELMPIYGAKTLYKIEDEPVEIKDVYDDFVNKMNDSGIHFSKIPSYSKLESDKGAYTYFSRYLVKEAWDSYEIFSKLVSKFDIKNALIVTSNALLEMNSLSLVAKKLNKDIKINTLEPSRFGVYPKIGSTKYYGNSYRLNFSALNKDEFAKYDLIYISDIYDEKKNNIVSTFKNLLKLDKEVYIVSKSEIVNELFNKFNYLLLSNNINIKNDNAKYELADEESKVKVFKINNHKYSSLIK